MYEELELVPKQWLTLDEFEFWLTLDTALISLVSNRTLGKVPKNIRGGGFTPPTVKVFFGGKNSVNREWGVTT